SFEKTFCDERPSKGGVRLVADRQMKTYCKEMHQHQDRKNVLNDIQLSAALLAGKGVSFLEVVRKAVVFPPVNDAQKDHPFLKGFSYNHFIQPVAIIQITWDEPKRPLWIG